MHFVLYFFLCFRSLRDRAPASDAGSGGSSPFGSIFYCKNSAKHKAHCILFESTLSLGSDLTVLSIKHRFARFLQVPRPPNGFLKEYNGLFKLRYIYYLSISDRGFFQSNSHCPVFRIFLFYKIVPNLLFLSYHQGYFA